MSLSGRYPEHDICENFNAIDVRELQRKNLLRPGLCFTYEWFRNGAPSGKIFIMTQPDAIILTVKEVQLLMESARTRGRYGHRDATMILIAFRHGLRPAEVCALRWDMIDLGQGLLHVRRVKNGTPSVQPLGGGELRALRRLKREEIESRFVFMTERAAPITVAGYRKMISRTGESAEFPFPVHPHMLRHACGYKLANDGQDTRAVQHYLGHRNIQHTVRYTELSPERFKSFWED
jgi:site-specific recombinase XerD